MSTAVARASDEGRRRAAARVDADASAGNASRRAAARAAASSTHPVTTLNLFTGPSILVGDIRHRELDVSQRGALIDVTHEALQDREPHARTRHVDESTTLRYIELS